MSFSNKTKKIKRILYIGAFNLLDFNASALRAIHNAKCFEELGLETIICGYSNNDFFQKEYSNSISLVNFKRTNGFKDFYRYSTNIKHLLGLIKGCDAVICYNYPSIASLKMRRYCKKKNIYFLCDCTEWYSPKDKNLVIRFIKSIDSFLRMRFINKKNDGLIVISKRLFSYYDSAFRKTIVVPPLNASEKTIPVKNNNNDMLSFTYCGMTDNDKDDLNLISKVFDDVALKYKNVLLTIIGTKKEDLKYKPVSKNIVFLGYLPHDEALKVLSKSNCTILIRENNRRNDYGFPTKFSESLSLGIPIISNDFSDIKDFISKNGFVIDKNNIANDIIRIIQNGSIKGIKLIDNLLSYKYYIDKFSAFFSIIGAENGK